MLLIAAWSPAGTKTSFARAPHFLDLGAGPFGTREHLALELALRPVRGQFRSSLLT
jgi:hypothetical protein